MGGDCIRQQTIVRYLKHKLPPAMYARSEGQVEEGGDPDGLPVCKAMYRVKHHTHKLFEQLTDRTYFNGARSGCYDLCRQVAEAKIPVYARNYRDDGAEVNMKGFERVWALLRQGAPGASSYTVAPGAHHMFYSDSTAAGASPRRLASQLRTAICPLICPLATIWAVGGRSGRTKWALPTAPPRARLFS